MHLDFKTRQIEYLNRDFNFKLITNQQQTEQMNKELIGILLEHGGIDSKSDLI